MDNIIKFICYDKTIVDLYPPQPASKIIPDWYKQIPNEIMHGQEKHAVPTIKKCVPVLDYLTTGYILRHAYQTDFKVLNEHGRRDTEYMCPMKDYVSAHPHEQCPIKIEGDNHNYIKFNQPWMVRTPPGYSTLFFQPFYNMNEDYVMFPSVVDTDTHDDSVNFVGYAKQDFVADPGDPLMIAMPFKRDNWKSEIIYDDYLGKTVYSHFIKKVWHGTYAKFFHQKKNYR